MTNEHEGKSTLLDISISRLNNLAEVCYYDDDANLEKSIVLRNNWVNKACLAAYRIVCLIIVR